MSAGASSGRDLPSQELLEDICIRFIVNKPEEDRATVERLLFLVEEAHWYYEDHLCPSHPNLRSLSFREFVSLIFDTCPGLEKYKEQQDQLLKQFQTFKHQVPVMGAIMLNPAMDKVLLVKGWRGNAAWGFPRGKRMKNEADEDCAVREVYEETGFDIKEMYNPVDFLEVFAGPQKIKLYIVANVLEETHFQPQAQKEIGAIAWYQLSDLPSSKQDSHKIYQNTEGESHRFYMVHPFVERLHEWIATHKNRVGQPQRQPALRVATRPGHPKPSPPRAAVRQPDAQQPLEQRASGQQPLTQRSSTHRLIAPQPASHQPVVQQLRQMAPSGPGVLLNFRFDRAAIERCLVFN
ncbi:unnamed protein product [Ostreobium quekettii]|uniref:Nudix hydrolase domain-containing protein n=1 Tax=Ostreobium quekettii TaxID=121088 RepID=A0A8S1J2D7_9CHLO|nr:unnamed protein product [Ostreobium quekettii]|eukprot:evm.model.scf_1113EXC.5 EVM.evm.TU.scf_1113EXC.5   scf_1113EXC:37373-42586(-)